MHRPPFVREKPFPSGFRETTAVIVAVNIGRCDDYWKSDDRGAVETTAGAAGESTLSEVLVTATRFVGALGPALILIGPTATSRHDMPMPQVMSAKGFWGKLKPFRGGGRTNGESGKKRRYLL